MIRGWLRAAILAACAAATAASLWRFADDSARRRRAEEFAEKFSVELRAPELYHLALYETSADLAFADLARQALQDATAPVALATLSPAERAAWISVKERGDDELGEARRLCLDALRRRPAWGDDAFAVGATTYVQWQRRNDEQLISRQSSWDEPLSLAARLEPAADDIASFRAQTQLQTRRPLDRAAHAILRRAFLNPAAFEELFPEDVRASGGIETCRGDIPNLLPQQRSALAFLADSGDVDGYLAQASVCDRVARQRATVLSDEMSTALRAGRPELAGERSEELFSTLQLSEAPPEGFVRALECWPPDHIEEWGQGPRLAAFEALLDHEEGRLTAASVARTIETVTHVPPAALARLRLLAGDAAEADRLEASNAGRIDLDWWQYALTKARLALRQGRTRKARATLDALPESLRSSFETRALYAAICAAESRPYSLEARAIYPAGAWEIYPGAPLARGGKAVLSVEAGPGVGSAEVDLESASPAAVEIRWDGVVAIRSRLAGRAVLAVPLLRAPGRHEMELTAAVGGPVTPGAVRLAATPPRRMTTPAGARTSRESPESRN